MRIAVTGRDGQVARALAERGPGEGVTILRLGRPDLDLTRTDTILPVLRAARPDAVVNAAAYTAVDAAEREPDLADAVNHRGAGAVARAAAILDVPVIQLSTDYVFDGASPRPYRPDDPAGPLGVYGRTKFLGERAVAAAHPRAVILRTSWIYGPFGRNFVTAMLALAAARDEVAVVDDQHGCPTAALDLAGGLIAVARQLRDGTPARPDAELGGTFHMAGQGEASWADLAEAVMARSALRGGPRARVRRIGTADYPTATTRPVNSRLDCTTLADAYGIRLPPWRDSLDACVDRVAAESRRIAPSA